MPYDFDDEAKLTNRELSEEIAKITTLSTDQLDRLLPRKVDKQRLSRLIAIVNSAASQNTKIATLRSNFEDLGTVVFKILKTVL